MNAHPGFLEFACPSCGELNTVEIEPEDGRDQEFVVDCWVCCRPNRIHWHAPDDDPDSTESGDFGVWSDNG